MALTIRDLAEPDLAGVVAIYNEVAATSTAIFDDRAATPASRRRWWQERVGLGYPVLIAVDGDLVLGFSSFGDFRSWPGYRHTVEHTVHVRADARRCGVGRGLVEALFPRAAALDKHVMVGGVDAANEASIRFHERLGFERVGLLREVGRKFDRWLDLAFLQRFV